MKKTIINEGQLQYLVDIGVLYKTRDGTYEIIINNKVWGYICMPKNMVRAVAGKTIDVKVDKCDDEVDRWVTEDSDAWYIQPWMLVDYYDRIKEWGKYRPWPIETGDDPGIDKYRLQIISRTHLDELVEKGIVTKEKFGDGYVYRPVIMDMGGITMPDIMAEQMCGKTFDCDGTGTTWIEKETEHGWSIAQWMLEKNYAYLLSRKDGCLDTDDLEDEEEPEEEEEEVYTRNHVDIVGEIIEKTGDTILVSTEHTDILVHFVAGDKYGVGQRVSVEGHLVRISNMMGYPEINGTWIQEV